MKVQEKLDEIKALVRGARSLPMSSSIVVNKSELSRLLTELGELLPDDLAQAEAVLRRRDAMLYEATANAERLLTAAIEERARMISEEEVLREARIQAAEMIREAQERSERTSREIDEYVDAKLAHFEVSVTNILETVRQGRQRLAQPGLYGELASLPETGPVLGHEPVPLPQRQVSPDAAGSYSLGGSTDRTAEWSAPPRWATQAGDDALPRWGPMPPGDGPDEGSDLLPGRVEPGGIAESGPGSATRDSGGGWTPSRPGDSGELNGGVGSGPAEPTASGQPAIAEVEFAAVDAGQVDPGAPPRTGDDVSDTEGRSVVSEGESAVSEGESAVSEADRNAEVERSGEPADEAAHAGDHTAEQSGPRTRDQPEGGDGTAVEPRPQEARAE
ncbi:MAG TPA: hypothetical protein VFY84_07960 [Jiangellales bacterium]|nr:hypothetical protein [Jiangellales bacterium]